MEFSQAVRNRRSIRKYRKTPVPAAVIEQALELAILAPNSSNTQTWDFYWVQSENKKKKLVEACLSQSAARTAAELIVVTADPKRWKRSQSALIQWVKDSKAPSVVLMYYQRLIPATHRWGFLNSFAIPKWILATAVGLVRPMLRGPYTRRDLQEVAIKSAALAAQNFVLSIADQGYASCMMEGFDEWRVKSLLGLGFSARAVMVIAVGEADDRGTWGAQMRLPKESVVHKV